MINDNYLGLSARFLHRKKKMFIGITKEYEKKWENHQNIHKHTFGIIAICGVENHNLVVIILNLMYIYVPSCNNTSTSLRFWHDFRAIVIRHVMSCFSYFISVKFALYDYHLR